MGFIPAVVALLGKGVTARGSLFIEAGALCDAEEVETVTVELYNDARRKTYSLRERLGDGLFLPIQRRSNVCDPCHIRNGTNAGRLLAKLQQATRILHKQGAFDDQIATS